MLRPTTLADSDLLVELAEATRVFKPHELVALEEVLADYHGLNQVQGHVAVTWDEGEDVRGFAYYAPAALTLGTWYLYWIAVAPACQGQGLGRRMLEHAEEDILRRDGRLLLIETSSQSSYDATRRFYVRQGYAHEATLRDFYAPGDDLVVFRKELS